MAGREKATGSSGLGKDSFAVVDVGEWIESRDEPMGSAVKRWLEAPGGSSFAEIAETWLFKEVREKAVQGEWRVFGEDWSEKVVAELATALGVPAVRVDLAVIGRTRGVLIPSFTRTPEEWFTPGNELLAGLDRAYLVDKTGQVPGYTLQAVREALASCRPPPDLDLVASDAFDAFAGYLLLDALVANTDRHHENWGVLGRAQESARLAPSYDHGTSLGFQEPDERKSDLLEGSYGGVRWWAGRGSSRHFESKPNLVELAAGALRLASEAAATHWQTRLQALDADVWERILDRIPDGRMSQVERRFAAALVRVNKERLLDVC